MFFFGGWGAIRILEIVQFNHWKEKDQILDKHCPHRENPIAKCAVAAMKQGYKMFAIQNGGWCAASKTAQKPSTSTENLQLVRVMVKEDHGLISFT